MLANAHGHALSVHTITDCQVDIVWCNNQGTARDTMADFHLINAPHTTTTALTRHVGRLVEREFLSCQI